MQMNKKTTRMKRTSISLILVNSLKDSPNCMKTINLLFKEREIRIKMLYSIRMMMISVITEKILKINFEKF